MARVLIDSRECFTAMQAFCNDYMPEVAGLLEHYGGERPLFELHAVEDEIQRALEARVELKSGGYLIIDQTEAMTTIDVNTGSFVGGRNQAETILKTNLEAATALARQLREPGDWARAQDAAVDQDIPRALLHRHDLVRLGEALQGQGVDVPIPGDGVDAPALAQQRGHPLGVTRDPVFQLRRRHAPGDMGAQFVEEVLGGVHGCLAWFM